MDIKKNILETLENLDAISKEKAKYEIHKEYLEKQVAKYEKKKQ